MAKPQAQPAPQPPRGIPPGHLNMLANRLAKLIPLGNPEWANLADRVRDAADRDDAVALDLALENLGSAYVLLAALAGDLQTLSTSLVSQLAQINGKLNSLDARVTALERRP